jgi:tripartite-type tricarboxylate transporter receptor subunit TctC
MCPLLARAQSPAWPIKPINMIAPYPAGGGIDTVARIVAERLAAKLNQPVTVENKPGAGSTIGGAALAKSAPDGYTLLLGSIVDYAIAPHAYPSLSFDVQKDMIPVVDIGFGTVALIVTADLPARNLKELIAMAKAKPGSLSFASSGIGGVHVPYKGSSQLMPDLIAGRVPLSIDSIPAHLANIKAGKTRALAVANSSRSNALPDVPTFAEAGLPGYETATNYTLFAPAKTPADVVALLNKELNLMLQQPALIEKFATLGLTIRGGTTEAAQNRTSIEVAKWANVIRKGNIVLN